MDQDVLLRRVGTVICGKWTLERLLGVGGMAAVYVGLHKIGRRDAIKMLHPEAAKSKEVCRRFEREARVVNRFRHPGAVEIRDIDTTDDGAPFLVMELLSGETLLDLVQRAGPPPLDDLLRYAEEVLDVLVAAHAQGIIHRDIKPGNLFVTDEGRIKVLDFGLARAREAGDSKSLWTKAGAALGTTPYMPPEQARGLDIDARVDVFAVGATLFRLITGRRIHDATEDFELLMKMSKVPAPLLRSVKPEVPEDVALVVDRALQFDRNQRYPHAAAMLDDLRALRAGQRPPNALGMMMLEDIDRTADTVIPGRPPAAASPAAKPPAAPPDTGSIDVVISSVTPSIDVHLESVPSEGIDVSLGSDTRSDPTPVTSPNEPTFVSPRKGGSRP